jgi:PAS domain S-box-containing protein
VQVRTQELQEREQFLQTVLDTFPLSVFWKDINSVYLGCNQNLLREAGLSTIAQIIGKTDYELPWGETEADIYQADDREVIESQTAKLGIVETQHQANGQIIWVETNKLPLRNLQGDVIGVLGTYQDISDRKAVEKALMLKQRHLAALMNNIPHIAWIKDEQSRFIAVNTPFVQACGVSAEELVGKTDFDIWSADLAQAYRDDDAEVLQSGQRKVVVEKVARTDGTLGWFETGATLT